MHDGHGPESIRLRSRGHEQTDDLPTQKRHIARGHEGKSGRLGSGMTSMTSMTSSINGEYSPQPVADARERPGAGRTIVHDAHAVEGWQPLPSRRHHDRRAHLGRHHRDDMFQKRFSLKCEQRLAAAGRRDRCQPGGAAAGQHDAHRCQTGRLHRGMKS